MHPIIPQTSELTTYCSDNITTELTFSDGSKATYDSKILKTFPLFENLVPGFEVAKFLKDNLQLVIELFHNNRHILDILDEKSLTDPKTYKNLESLIQVLFCNESYGALETIKEELSSLKYPLALQLLNNYQKENDADEPFYIRTIEKVVLNNMCFDNPEEYETKHLLLLRTSQRDTALKIRNLRILRESNESTSTILKEKNHIDWCRQRLERIHKKIKIKSIAPSKLYILSHITAEDENMAQALRLAKRCWKIYKAKTLNCLQYQIGKGARMHRREFVSPKLFAHYDLIPHFHTRYKSEILPAFTHLKFQNKNAIHYRFENKHINILDLEDEIRGDLSAYINDFSDNSDDSTDNAFVLPEKLFKDPPAIKNVSEVPLKLQELRDSLLPSFCNGNKSPQAILAQKNPLIKLWVWDKRGITARDFTFTLLLYPKLQKEDIVRVKGTLYKFDKTIRFFFKFDDFKPVILDYSIDPTPEATKAFLKKLHQKKDIDLKSKFNFFHYVKIFNPEAYLYPSVDVNRAYIPIPESF
jgi:hypothetical protein